jgi:signal transduction histidine kinase
MVADNPPANCDEPLTASILLVDDRPANLLALEGVLAPLGHNLVLARSGEEALQQLLKQDFALILMDVQMPDLDGFQTVALIKKRERQKDIPVIFVTAIAKETEAIVRGYQYGAVDYITKPFDPEILKAKVSVLIALYLQAERIARQQRLLEEERQRLHAAQTRREMAEAAVRVKDEFLAMVSHELRAPLHAILGWADLLQSGRLTPERTRHALGTIQRNARLQTQLIDDLLDLSRIVRGKLRMKTERIRLADILDKAIDTVRPAAEAKGVTLTVELDRETDEGTGDPDRLQQVMWNLLNNAVKFTPPGGRVVTRLRRHLAGFEIEVEDNGAGIAPEELPLVFDRFWQSERVGARQSPAGLGLGLGLTIVRHLVELHGGQVAVESGGPGRGTRFLVRLPIRAVQVETTEVERGQATPPREREALQAAPSLRGLRVLVVDDEEDARDVLAHLLEHVGAETRVAASVDDALEVVEHEHVDVVLSDLGMPRRDGYALIRELCARPSHPPALALSAYATPEDAERACASGFDAHLAKPVDAARLVSAIARVAREHGQGAFSGPCP